MTAPVEDLDRLVTEFVERVPGVAHAVVVAADGLPVAWSSEVPPERAEQLAAITYGLMTLTDGASRACGGGPVGRTVVDMRRGSFVVTAVGHGAMLAVLLGPRSDRSRVDREIALLRVRVGRGTTPAPGVPGRRPGGDPLTGVLVRALTAEIERRPGSDDHRAWFEAGR